jgi:hypothetical protein
MIGRRLTEGGKLSAFLAGDLAMRPLLLALGLALAAGAAQAQNTGMGAGMGAGMCPGNMPHGQMPPAQMPHGQMPHGQMPHAGGMMHGQAAAGAKGDQGLIASAMTAAPAAVSRGATIIDVGADGKIRTVRQGAGFTCMADNPETPGPDPMCMDAAAVDWAKAWMAHQPPPRKTGFMYMLAGGTDASNTDPYAKAPSRANHWVKTGPHVMIVGDPEILAGYPSGADPDTTQPYVMWAGTPYAHLMIPVR